MGGKERFNEKDLLTQGSDDQLVWYKNKKYTSFVMIQILRPMDYDHTENAMCIFIPVAVVSIENLGENQ